MDDHSIRGSQNVSFPQADQVKDQEFMNAPPPPWNSGAHQTSNWTSSEYLQDSTMLSHIALVGAGLSTTDEIQAESPTAESVLAGGTCAIAAGLSDVTSSFGLTDPNDPESTHLSESLVEGMSDLFASQLPGQPTVTPSATQEDSPDFAMGRSYLDLQAILPETIENNSKELIRIADNLQGSALATEINEALVTRASNILVEGRADTNWINQNHPFLTTVADRQGGALARDINAVLAERARELIGLGTNQIQSNLTFLRAIANRAEEGLANEINEVIRVFNERTDVPQESFPSISTVSTLDARATLVEEARDVLVRANTDPSEIERNFAFLRMVADRESHLEGEINEALAARARELIGLGTGQIEENLFTFLRTVANRAEEGLANAINEAIRISEEMTTASAVDVSAFDTFETTVSLETTTSKVKESPKELLSELMNKFDNREFEDRLKIYFRGEAGIDFGGPSRQFISDLFSGLAEKVPFKAYHGRFRPEVKSGDSLSPEDEKTYRNIGRLLMFCLNASDSYPIGLIFEKGVYDGIKTFSDELLIMPFSELKDDINNFNRLFEIYVKLHFDDDANKKTIDDFKKNLGTWDKEKDGMIEIVYEVAEQFLSEEDRANIGDDVKKMREQKDAIQNAFRKHLMQNVFPQKLAPLHAIAYGMRNAEFQSKTSWGDVQAMATDRLETSLQGVVTPEKVIEKLDFHEVSDEHAEWVKKWINECGEEKMQLFLYELTGSRTIGEAKKIEIYHDHDRGLYYGTCGHKLRVPFHVYADYEAFKDVIDKEVAGGGQGTSKFTQV